MRVEQPKEVVGNKPDMLHHQRLIHFCHELPHPLRKVTMTRRVGRIGIPHKVSVPPQHSASPRVGHLEAAHHVFGHLLAHSKSKLVLDPAPPKPEMDESAFQHGADWVPFCGDVEEELPPKVPKPRGKKVSTHCFFVPTMLGMLLLVAATQAF
jgi:hypothetical protein